MRFYCWINFNKLTFSFCLDAFRELQLERPDPEAPEWRAV